MLALKKAIKLQHIPALIGSLRYKSTAVNIENKLNDDSSHNYNTPFSSYYTPKMEKLTAEFLSYFDGVVHDLTEFGETDIELKDAANHFEKTLNYVVPHGKKIRALTIVSAYTDLVDKEQLTQENIEKAHLLAWSAEINQAAWLVADDIIDESDIRRFKPTYHKLEHVQTIAINDVILLENSSFTMIQRIFSKMPCYMSIIEFMLEVNKFTGIGMLLDFLRSKDDVMSFTEKKYRCIAGNKAGYFGFYYPIGLAMILAGYNYNDNKKLFDDVKNICYELGYYYAAQNDFLDVFKDMSVLNKIGTDIQNGKCTWLSVKAMEIGTDYHRSIMKECYGKNDPESINKVKDVFIELNFPEEYNNFEDHQYNKIKLQIEQNLTSNDRVQNMMIKFLNNTFNRN